MLAEITQISSRVARLPLGGTALSDLSWTKGR